MEDVRKEMFIDVSSSLFAARCYA